MKANTSIKVQAGFADLVRSAAARAHRSVAGQLEYWARIGRAVEATPIAHKHIEDAANGRLDAKALTDEELSFFEEAFALAHLAPEEDTAFANYLRQHGSGVGVDDADRIVKRDRAGKVTVIAEHVGD
jgi:hypothetical protein